MKQKTRWVRYAGRRPARWSRSPNSSCTILGISSQLYRIGAFIGVAIILIVASFVYQRFLVPKAAHAAAASPVAVALWAT